MRKVEELTDPISCLNRAAMDEPLFVLRANDANAPAIVQKWAADYLDRKQREGHWNEDCQLKWETAVSIAAQMIEWRKQKYAPHPPLGSTASG